MSPGPTRLGRRGHDVSNDPPSGAMATPPTAATSMPVTSAPRPRRAPTTRVTDTLERMMAQALNNPWRRPCPTVAPYAAAAPPRERAQMCEPDADMTGQPQGPTVKLGRTDGSCPELTPPTEGKTRQRAAARDFRFARTKLRCDPNHSDGRIIPMRFLRCRSDPIFLISFVRPTVRLTCGAARPLRPWRIASRRDARTSPARQTNRR